MVVNGVKIVFLKDFEMDEEEIKAYIERRDKNKILIQLDINLDDEFVDLYYHYKKPFNKIRRITGYLTGDTNTWNNGKLAELNDRVKHI